MLATILVLTAVFGAALVAIFRPAVGVIAFYGLYLLQPEWNWRWTPLYSFNFHQDLLAISTLVGTLMTFGQGNRLTKTTAWAYGCLAAFLAIAFLSYTQSINPMGSWFYLDILWKSILMAALAAYHLDSPQRIYAMIWTIVLTQGYNAYQINLQYFQDGYSRYALTTNWGFRGDNNIYTNATIPILACSVALMVFANRSWQKVLAAGIALLQVHQIMLFESRGGMLGGVVTAVCFYTLIPKTPRAILIGVLVFAGSAGLAGPPVVKEFTSSFQGRENLDRSAQSRFELWKAGWQITKENPILGVGPNAGRYLVGDYYVVASGQTKDLHNLFFEISAGCGLPAALVYCAHFAILWLSLLILYLRRRSTFEVMPVQCAALATLAGLPGFWVANMFSGGAMIETTYLSAAIGAAAICVQHRLQPAEPSAASRFMECDEESAIGRDQLSAQTC